MKLKEYLAHNNLKDEFEKYLKSFTIFQSLEEYLACLISPIDLQNALRIEDWHETDLGVEAHAGWIKHIQQDRREKDAN